MKKRLSWAILALVLIFNGVAPVYAAEVSPAPEGEWILLSDEQVATITPIDPAANTGINAGEDLPTPIAYPSVHGAVYPIALYPTALAEINGTLGVYSYSGIGTTKTFPSLSQFEEISLTTSATASLTSRLEATLEASNISYELYGWYMEVEFVFEAPTPVSFAWYASETNMTSSQTKTTSLSGYGSAVSLTVPFNFPYPPNIDENNDRYQIKLGGRYTARNLNNQTLEMDVFATGILNAG